MEKEKRKIINVEQKNDKQNKSLVVVFRIFQSIFFGVFALGISMALGDYGKYVEWPISNLSVTITVFGIIGAIISGIQAKECEKW
jgi:hypothetical protein